jgi:phosphoglycerate dehydrogenase-like enzyme
MTMTTTSSTSTTPQGAEPLFWNKETNTFRNYDDIPITRTAKIVSISHHNEPDNELLHTSRPLPLGCELVQIVSSVKDIDIEQLRDVNVIFCSYMKNAREPLAYLVENLPNLQWIHCRQTGIDYLHSESLTKWGQQQQQNDMSNGRIMTNAKGQFSSTLAEYAMGAMTYFAKDFPRLQRSKANKTWDKYVVWMVLTGLFHCNAAATHFFSAVCNTVTHDPLRWSRADFRCSNSAAPRWASWAGQATARLAKAYGMKILALGRRQPVDDGIADERFDGSQLHHVLSRSDYVVCAAPLTPATTEMMGAAEFAAIKKGSVFINVGRGPTVHEPALIDALSSGHLKGAGLDVFCTEPLPQSSPFWDLDNVLLSPHNMDKTDTFMIESVEFYCREQLPRFVRGLPLYNPVDQRLGY